MGVPPKTTSRPVTNLQMSASALSGHFFSPPRLRSRSSRAHEAIGRPCARGVWDGRLDLRAAFAQRSSLRGCWRRRAYGERACRGRDGSIPLRPPKCLSTRAHCLHESQSGSIPGRVQTLVPRLRARQGSCWSREPSRSDTELMGAKAPAEGSGCQHMPCAPLPTAVALDGYRIVLRIGGPTAMTAPGSWTVEDQTWSHARSRAPQKRCRAD
jgi:hypothetical protein